MAKKSKAKAKKAPSIKHAGGYSYHVTASGRPDKRYSDARWLKADGTPDRRRKEARIVEAKGISLQSKETAAISSVIRQKHKAKDIQYSSMGNAVISNLTTFDELGVNKYAIRVNGKTRRISLDKMNELLEAIEDAAGDEYLRYKIRMQPGKGLQIVDLDKSYSPLNEGNLSDIYNDLKDE